MFEKKKKPKAHKLTLSFLTASHWIFAPKVEKKRKEKEREKVEASRGRAGKEEKRRKKGWLNCEDS